jgi:hypothetical protein
MTKVVVHATPSRSAIRDVFSSKRELQQPLSACHFPHSEACLHENPFVRGPQA